MPFRSAAQRGYLFANKPDVAKEFAAHTSKLQTARLPVRAPTKPPQPPKPSRPPTRSSGRVSPRSITRPDVDTDLPKKDR